MHGGDYTREQISEMPTNVSRAHGADNSQTQDLTVNNLSMSQTNKDSVLGPTQKSLSRSQATIKPVKPAKQEAKNFGQSKLAELAMKNIVNDLVQEMDILDRVQVRPGEQFKTLNDDTFETIKNSFYNQALSSSRSLRSNSQLNNSITSQRSNRSTKTRTRDGRVKRSALQGTVSPTK